MPVSSRRCGMITRREAERLCKSFIGDNTPPRLPENFSFSVQHKCAWGCQGAFIPIRYNSSRAKCIKCNYCGMFFSPNKFIFHSHRIEPTGLYVQPDAANFNSWRRHLTLAGEPSLEVVYMWEDVKAMFNGGTRKRLTGPRSSSFESRHQMAAAAAAAAAARSQDLSHSNEMVIKNSDLMERETSDKAERKSNANNYIGPALAGPGAAAAVCVSTPPFDYLGKDRHAYELCDKQDATAVDCMIMKDCYMAARNGPRNPLYPGRCPQPQQALTKAGSYDSLKNLASDANKHNTITFSNTDTSISMQCASQSAIISSNLSQFLRTSAFKPVLRSASQATVTLESIGLTISQITPPLFCLNISTPPLSHCRKDGSGGGSAASATGCNSALLDLKAARDEKYYSLSPDVYGGDNSNYYQQHHHHHNHEHNDEGDDTSSRDESKEDAVIDIETSEDDDNKPAGLLKSNNNNIITKMCSSDRCATNSAENNVNNNSGEDVYIDVVNENGDTVIDPLKPFKVLQTGSGPKYYNDLKLM